MPRRAHLIVAVLALLLGSGVLAQASGLGLTAEGLEAGHGQAAVFPGSFAWETFPNTSTNLDGQPLDSGLGTWHESGGGTASDWTSQNGVANPPAWLLSTSRLTVDTAFTNGEAHLTVTRSGYGILTPEGIGLVLRSTSLGSFVALRTRSTVINQITVTLDDPVQPSRSWTVTGTTVRMHVRIYGTQIRVWLNEADRGTYTVTATGGTNWGLLAEPGTAGLVYGWDADNYLVRQINSLDP